MKNEENNGYILHLQDRIRNQQALINRLENDRFRGKHINQIMFSLAVFWSVGALVIICLS